MEGLFNGVAFSLLLTSVFVLRFRGWERPGMVVAYFIFFSLLEVIASHFFLPPGAFGPTLASVCLGLSVPVLLAAYFLWRHERNQGQLGSKD